MQSRPSPAFLHSACVNWWMINEVTARMNGMTRADLEAMMLDGLIDQLRANAPDLDHLSVDAIKQKTA